MVEKQLIDVQVVYFIQHNQIILNFSVPNGTTIGDVLRDFAHITVPENHGVGIFGKIRDVSTRLNLGDRIEIYPPLPLDPKIARRKRAKKQLNGKKLLSKVLQNRRKIQCANNPKHDDVK